MPGTRDCEGRVAVVTGASRGIGKAIAYRLAAEGAAVCVTGRTVAARASPAARLARRDGRRRSAPRAGRPPRSPPTSPTPRSTARTIVDAAHEAFGAPVDILVNNAAAPRTFDLDLEHTTRDGVHGGGLRQRVGGVGTQRARHPRHARAGRRVDRQRVVGSAGPKVGPPYPPSQVGAQVLYGSTKAMLDRITTGAAMELFDDHIAVNSLAPEAAILTENASTLIKVPDKHRRAGRDVRRGDAGTLHRRPRRAHRAGGDEPVAARRAATDRCAPSTATRSSPAGSPTRSTRPASARATCAPVPRRRHRHGIRCRG